MKISALDIETAEAFAKEVNTQFRDRLRETENADFFTFVELYFHQYPREELVGQNWDDLFGCLYGWWEFLQKFDRSSSKVRVFNPSLEEHGWLSSHTAIAVLHRDVPFLVDSIRLEINRRNIAIHTIKSTLISVERNESSELLRVLPGKSSDKLPSADAAQGLAANESLLFLEINRHTDKQALHEISSAISDVLKSVDAVVNSYHPLLEQAQASIDNIKHARSQCSDDSLLTEMARAEIFLQWMREGYFTFMGYAEYDIKKSKSGKELVENIESRMGIAKLLDIPARRIDLSEDLPGVKQFYESSRVINFAKAFARSRVHRSAYPDYVIVKRFDKNGNVCGESRFKGLYTAEVYNDSPTAIPIISDKVGYVFSKAGLEVDSHTGKMLKQILETFPRDELFQSTPEELYDVAIRIAQINERYRVRLFMRRGPYGKFVSCMLYVPKDIFNTQVRLKIQSIIGEVLGATEQEFTTYFSESILARVHLVFKINPKSPLEFDVKELEQRIIDVIRSWGEHLATSLVETLGEEKGTQFYNQYKDGFSNAYRESYDARTAVHDIQMLDELNGDTDIVMSFYQPIGSEERSVRFKIFRKDHALELSDIIPLLENLGLRVIGEHPYQLRRVVSGEKQMIWLHDFSLEYNLPTIIDVNAARQNFHESFLAIWQGKVESDEFNHLVLGARLNWPEVNILRAYAAYMKQTMFNFSQSYIASTLSAHLDITRNLIALFKANFDPRINQSTDKDRERIDRLTDKILKSLDAVENLNEDRIIRRYLDLIQGTLRTNYFQVDSNGKRKEYLSIKFSPRTIADIPEPRPKFEIFVYSPRVEGVHLRGGAVARGGLRWSDRFEDYRTEVLGLVKAQHVKNAVIVPGGAKGGFIAKSVMPHFTREETFEEGVACYKTFISGLLDITDNLINNEIAPPEQVVRKDGDDPYLVVAADKGTATFSDIANAISKDYNHWLGDAFASGGSQGYDHKGMGITARGAWVSVRRHFKEKGIDIQKDDFTVVGIGDMAGDVFGNGMLLSEHICLTAAFNHLHIFVDPNPNAAKSFKERQRLFALPKSSWSDYDDTLISKGGGVFSRSLKSISISPEMKKRFGISASSLTPNELISALLRSPVDLLWNGGIGTYIKSRNESHADVGDKANDTLRVNGDELRCKVFGEGGNLGMTQLGRVEFCLNGGACNTDFIDNSAGVDCSDHEVNIKILLNDLVVNGDMTEKQRNQLLAEMTDEVAELVLDNNYQQTLSISIASSQAVQRMGEYRRFINDLQTKGTLDRQLEFIPEDEVLIERQTAGIGLTRPELSVLVSYSKVELKEVLAKSDLAADSYMAKCLNKPFPTPLQQRFSDAIAAHRLRNEIIATQLANDMVNTMGFTFVQRLSESTGASADQIAKAYVTARDIFGFPEFKHAVEGFDYKIPADLQSEMLIGMVRRVRRGTRWFLRNRRGQLSPEQEINTFLPLMQDISASLPDVLRGDSLVQWNSEYNRLINLGVSSELATALAMPTNLYSGLGMIEAAQQSETSVHKAAQTYFILGDKISLGWFANEVSEVKVESYWQAMARESYMDDLEAQMRTLSVAIIRLAGPEGDIEETVEKWMAFHSTLVGRWRDMITELQAAPGTDFAMFSVALRELLDLAQASQHCISLDEAC
ncbi:NAD-glutamate dehydrogenase GdhB [Aurantivibrio plasticivorans]